MVTSVPPPAITTQPMPRLDTSTTNTNTRSPNKELVSAMFHHYAINLPLMTPPVVSDRTSLTNSSTEPSPQATSMEFKALYETRSRDQDHEPEEQDESWNHEIDEAEELRETLLRRSTGSIAIMTRQQEAFDYRRHTFSVMSAESRASMRRRSFDFTAQFGHTYPPTSSSLPLSHSLNAHQHLRVYGKSTSPAKRLSECHEKGAPFVALVAPHSVTVWTRGKPVMIEWKVLDTKVEKLCIELLEDGLNATTLIAKEAPNSGFFTYPKVPWGMESGSKYFLRISASEDRERYCTSSFFQISSAP